jgi:hypothetical protein
MGGKTEVEKRERVERGKGEGREGRGRGERYCVCVSGGKEYLVINHNSFFFSISICSFVLCWCGEGENEEMSGGGRREEEEESVDRKRESELIPFSA